MARQTFGWFPDVAGEATDTPAVNVTVFGDGYEARQTDTINVNRQSWDLIFSKPRLGAAQEAQNIRLFLRARAGVESFNWTNPFGEAGVYVCRTWKSKSNQGEIVITATFTEVFEGE